MNHPHSVLILGATGSIGGAIALALLARGWRVRGMARDIEKVQRNGLDNVAWVRGDAMNRRDVVHAAEGVAMIVHAVNPPGYRNWRTLVLPMIDNTISAARSNGSSRIVLPGTIYNYDPTRVPVIDAHTLQAPRSRKGKIRVELERRLARAAPEVPSLILRAGDYFGPGARSSWFSQAMVRPGRPVTRVVNPWSGGGHSWAYLPDVAEAFARLMEAADQLAPFEQVQFEGLYDATGRGLIESLQRITGHVPSTRRFPWWLMHAVAPFGGFPREVSEIAPYWHHSVKLDNARLVELIGPEPHTDIDVAVRRTLDDMGCL